MEDVGATSLQEARHKKDGRKPPPKDTGALYTTIFQERFGRLGAAQAMAGHLLGRKF